MSSRRNHPSHPTHIAVEEPLQAFKVAGIAHIHCIGERRHRRTWLHTSVREESRHRIVNRRRRREPRDGRDRKSTRLNSSHGYISYAVFCLKKKTKNI